MIRLLRYMKKLSEREGKEKRERVRVGKEKVRERKDVGRC